jgi:hypothetical protein
MIAKLFDLVKQHQYIIFLSICIVLIATISYNLGKINSNPKGSITITESDQALIFKAASSPEGDNPDNLELKPSSNIPKNQAVLPVTGKDPRVVASKNSDKYHHAYCSSAKSIKEENKLWFSSATEAERLGYKLAGNCKP